MPTFEATAAGYRNLWAKCKVTKTAVADRVVARIVSVSDRYKAVEAKTGVPWFWIACVHDRESGGDFRGVLHNGERIIGTGRRTRLVPSGRGPFATWEDAAVDAIRMHGLHLITEWPIERVLFEAERFNGFGYYARGVNSPYVWAGTSNQQPGKYVSDGVWSSSAWDQQLGVAAVLMRLAAADATAKAKIEQRKPSAPSVRSPPNAQPPKPEPAPTPSPKPASGGLFSWLLGLLGLFKRK